MGTGCGQDYDCASLICVCGDEDVCPIGAETLCGPLPSGNTTCGRDADCTSGVCNFAFKLCNARADGYGCTRDKECTSGVCTGGLCGGHACAMDTQCGPGLVCGGAGACCGATGELTQPDPHLPDPSPSLCCSGVWTSAEAGCACTAPGGACRVATECCSGDCNEGTCA